MITSSTIPVQRSKLLKTKNSLNWDVFPATLNPKDILVKLNLSNGVLNMVGNELSSSNSIW